MQKKRDFCWFNLRPCIQNSNILLYSSSPFRVSYILFQEFEPNFFFTKEGWIEIAKSCCVQRIFNVIMQFCFRSLPEYGVVFDHILWETSSLMYILRSHDCCFQIFPTYHPLHILLSLSSWVFFKQFIVRWSNSGISPYRLLRKCICPHGVRRKVSIIGIGFNIFLKRNFVIVKQLFTVIPGYL